MIWIIVLIAVLALAVAFLFKPTVGTLSSPSEESLKYQPIETIFSPAERSFFSALEMAVGEELYIFAKVRVADVLKPQSGLSRSAWQKAFNKISSKHLDYILCSKTDLKILCAVELNDKSHIEKNRANRDKFINQAFAKTSTPIHFIKAKAYYNIDELKIIFAPLHEFASN